MEGYVESAASGLLAAVHLTDEILGRPKHVFDEMMHFFEVYKTLENKRIPAFMRLLQSSHIAHTIGTATQQYALVAQSSHTRQPNIIQ